MANEKQEQKQLQLNMDPKIAVGTFANIPVVNPAPTGFLVDFFSYLPGMPAAQQVSRLIIAPDVAKQLSVALNNQIAAFEKQFGVINIGQPAEPQASPSRVADPFGTNGEA